MTKTKNFFLFVIVLFFIFSPFLFSKNIFSPPPQIITTSSFTEGIGRNFYPDIDIITKKDIKLLGAENLPDILSIFSGINIYRVNSSTANIGVRGYPDEVGSGPKVLINGREKEDEIINKSYFYNFNLNIENIDRIEIVKDNSYYSDGYLSPAGLINIVTTSPDELGSNFIKLTRGSYDLKKLNFSINRFLLNTYFIFSGCIRAIDDYNSNKESNKNKFLKFSATRYIGDKSQLYVEAIASQGKALFKDSFYSEFIKNFYSTFNINAKNLRNRNIYISYKYPSLEISFIYNYHTGGVEASYTPFNSLINLSYGKTKITFTKFSIKKKYKFFTFGVEDKFYNIKFSGKNPELNNFATYLKSKFNFTKYITFKWLLRNNRITNYGNNFTYYFNGDIHSKQNNYGVSLSYSRDIKLPKNLYKYFNFNIKPQVLKGMFNINFIKNIDFFHNKNLRPTKVYSSNLKLYYSKNNFNIKTTLFYNRIIDTPIPVGKLDFLNQSVIFIPENKGYTTLHGIESELNYKINKNFKLFSSYFTQKIKIKTINKEKDFIVPKYKFLCGLIFDSSIISGSAIFNYMPQIHQINDISSDDYANLDINLIKEFYRDKIEISFAIKNLFNNVHRETIKGLNLKRNFILSINYKF